MPLSSHFLWAKGISASLLTLPAVVHEFAVEQAGLLPRHNIPCLSGYLYVHPCLPPGLRSRQCCGCPGMPGTLRASRSPLVTGHVGWFVSYFLAKTSSTPVGRQWWLDSIFSMTSFALHPHILHLVAAMCTHQVRQQDGCSEYLKQAVPKHISNSLLHTSLMAKLTFS